MQESDANRFRDLLRGMGRMFGAEPDALMLDAYWIALRDWDIADFQTACAQLMKTSQFMPRPHAFEELRKADRKTSGEAFDVAMNLARNASWGAMSTLTSGDPNIDAAARACGGYRALAMSDSSKVGFLEKRFSEHYSSISDREEIRDAVPLLTSRGFQHKAYLEHDEDAESVQ